MTSLFFALFYYFVASAAPMPGTSSSALISSNKGMFRSALGFSIHAGKTNWIHGMVADENPHISTIYKSPDVNSAHGVQASLTVRVDDLKSKMQLMEYVKQWQKDYPRFGFDILNARRVKLKDKTGFMLDLLNKTSDRQLRQVVFLKDKTAVILTCRDHRETFPNTLKSCNEIIRNFDWQ